MFKSSLGIPEPGYWMLEEERGRGAVGLVGVDHGGVDGAGVLGVVVDFAAGIRADCGGLGGEGTALMWPPLSAQK